MPHPKHVAPPRVDAPAQDEGEAWRDRLMGVLAHDVVGSLATMRLMSSLIEEPSLPLAHRDELVHRFGALVRRLECRTSDLFLADRLARGRAETRRRDVAIAPLVRNTVAGLDLAGREVNVDAVDVDVAVDAKQFTSVVDNLVSNALRHAPGAGPIEVTLRASPAELTLVVADHGPGIPRAARERIFELFGCVDTGAGTLGGIGLYVVAGVVTLHGGRVWVGNRRDGGQGAVFSVAIPRVAVRATE